MKINLEKLKDVEEQYKEQGLPNYTLHLMLSRVLGFEESPYSLAPNNVVLSINTLKDLGILEMGDNTQKTKKVEQIYVNS